VRAHEAVSRRPPTSLYTIVARTESYTYAAKVWVACTQQCCAARRRRLLSTGETGVEEVSLFPR
jgi:hypothetical protein